MALAQSSGCLICKLYHSAWWCFSPEVCVYFHLSSCQNVKLSPDMTFISHFLPHTFWYKQSSYLISWCRTLSNLYLLFDFFFPHTRFLHSSFDRPSVLLRSVTWVVMCHFYQLMIARHDHPVIFVDVPVLQDIASCVRQHEYLLISVHRPQASLPDFHHFHCPLMSFFGADDWIRFYQTIYAMLFMKAYVYHAIKPKDRGDWKDFQHMKKGT